MNLSKVFLCSCLVFPALTAWAVDVLEFNCKRVERNFPEEYEMKMMLASRSQKAKIFLDGRDLDQSDAFGTQVVQNITLSRPNILVSIEAKCAPEELMGVSYPVDSVMTNIMLDPVTGKLKKPKKYKAASWVQQLETAPTLVKRLTFLRKRPTRLGKWLRQALPQSLSLVRLQSPIWLGQRDMRRLKPERHTHISQTYQRAN